MVKNYTCCYGAHLFSRDKDLKVFPTRLPEEGRTGHCDRKRWLSNLMLIKTCCSVWIVSSHRKDGSELMQVCFIHNYVSA